METVGILVTIAFWDIPGHCDVCDKTRSKVPLSLVLENSSTPWRLVLGYTDKDLFVCAEGE